MKEKKNSVPKANIGLLVTAMVFAALTANMLRVNRQNGKELEQLRADLESARGAQPEEVVIVQPEEETPGDTVLQELRAEAVDARREVAELRQLISEKDQAIARLKQRFNRSKSKEDTTGQRVATLVRRPRFVEPPEPVEEGTFTLGPFEGLEGKVHDNFDKTKLGIPKVYFQQVTKGNAKSAGVRLKARDIDNANEVIILINGTMLKLPDEIFANDQWRVSTVSIPLGAVKDGENTISVTFNDNRGTRGFQLGYARIVLSTKENRWGHNQL